MRGAAFEKLGRTIKRKEKGLISDYNECLINEKNVETASARGIKKKKNSLICSSAMKRKTKRK